MQAKGLLVILYSAYILFYWGVTAETVVSTNPKQKVLKAILSIQKPSQLISFSKPVISEYTRAREIDIGPVLRCS